MSCVLWFPLDGTLKNNGLYSDAILTENGVTIDNDGKIGKCYSFNNTNIMVKCPSLKTLFSSSTQPFSMTTWIYLNTDETDRAIIFGNYNANPFINWELTTDGAQRLCAGGSSNYTSKVDSFIIPKTTWTHIAVTYNGTITAFYANGILKSTLTGANTVTTTTSSDTFYLGSDARTGTATRLKGKMNDFRLYDHALSAKEIEEISKGLILHYPLNDRYMENINNLVTGLTAGARTTVNNGVVTTTGENADTYFTVNLSETLAVGTTYTVSCWADMPEGSSWNFPIGKQASGISWYLSPGYNEKTFTPTDVSGWGNNRLFLDDASGRVTSSSCRFYNFQVEKKNYAAPFIGYGASHIASTVYDCSGYSHNGSIVNNLKIITSSPRYGYAVSFDNGQYIKKTDLHFANNIWSVSCWFKKISNLTNTYETILGYSKGNGADANKKFSIYTYNNKVGCVAEKTGGTSTVTINADLWHHVCLVNNAGSYTCYLDGASIKTFTNTNCLTDCTDFVVGGRAAVENATSIGTPWTGYVSDVRFYATALTIDQVKELYNTSMSIDANGNIHARELVE